MMRFSSVHDETSEASNLFGSYVDNVLDTIIVGDKCLHEVICKQYMLAIRDAVCFLPLSFAKSVKRRVATIATRILIERDQKKNRTKIQR